MMKELTKAEEQIMRVIWELESCYIKEIVAALPDPKPAYNTVGTFLKILENKGFVSREKTGNVYMYKPSVDRKEYSHKNIKSLVSKYFNGSAENLLSFMVEEKELSVDQVERLLKKLNKDD